jgi:ribonuclease HI
LYVDASYCPETGAAGWAAWVRSDVGRVQRAGVLPAYVEHSLHAELAAVFAGLYVAKRAWPELPAVLVRTDCQGILAHITRESEEPADPVLRRLRERIDSVGVVVTAAWVRGHAGGKHTASWLNCWCDAQARTQMVAERARRRGAGVVRGTS